MLFLASALALASVHSVPVDLSQASLAPTTLRRAAAGRGTLVARGLPSSGVPISTGTVAAPGSGCSPLLNGGFEFDLPGWTPFASPGGSPEGQVLVENGAAVLEEGASFLTSLSQSICLTDDARFLRFDLVGTEFDLSASLIPDAFEASLLDASFQSVVPTWGPGATSYFNVQEDGTQLPGSTVTVAGNTVSLDLTGVPRFTDLLLTFDLIGADTDTLGRVRIDNVYVDSGDPGVSYCEGLNCPCGNDSPGTGCLNTLGTGGLLASSGSASVAADDLVLSVSGITPTFALLIVGAAETCVQVGDGRLALSPGIGQPGVMRILVSNAQPNGDLTIGPGLLGVIDQVTGTPGFIASGSTWYFQVAYRDAPVSPCGQLFNFTNGLRVTFAN
ncbi:hypothetical protein Poly30_11050 [Planctomycetes bacterium Poly30]|uniref:Uncharacterized protein n=1 Tax=Saltatorellus ferox TaxID=2528018 RepID=A0A518ENE0_9BACT|nr:hypothetical protein Poly30_11050 [Planctomycetes bacterium Poly30]